MTPAAPFQPPVRRLVLVPAPRSRDDAELRRYRLARLSLEPPAHRPGRRPPAVDWRT